MILIKPVNARSSLKFLKRSFAVVFGFVGVMVAAYVFFAGIDRTIVVFPLNIPQLKVAAEKLQPFHVAGNYALF